MPSIIREGEFVVYVQSSEHPPPHCHVWRSGEAIAVVSLLSLEPIFSGQRLPRQIRDVMRDRIDELWDAWNEQNPLRQ